MFQILLLTVLTFEKKTTDSFFLKKRLIAIPTISSAITLKKKKKEWEGDTPFLFFFDPVKLQKQLYLQAAQVLTILCVKSEFSSLKYK